MNIHIYKVLGTPMGEPKNRRQPARRHIVRLSPAPPHSCSAFPHNANTNTQCVIHTHTTQCKYKYNKTCDTGIIQYLSNIFPCDLEIYLIFNPSRMQIPVSYTHLTLPTKA